MKVKVSTNAAGYALYINDSDSDTALNNLDARYNAKFTALSEDTSLSSFPMNSWGYSLDQDTWHGITPSPTKIKEVTDTMEGGTDTTEIHFGARANTAITAGIYHDSIKLTAIGKVAPEPVTIFDIKNMQDMSSPLCENTPTPSKTATESGTTLAAVKAAVGSDELSTLVPEVTLKDIRDNKTYLVRKLADGNCWMSQNLEFDILGEGDTYYTGTSSNAAANDSDVAVTDSNYFGGTVNESFTLTSEDTDLHTVDTWTPAIFRTAANTAGKPYAKVYRTITGTRETTDATYGWANNGNDGMRSYNYANSKADWAYSIPTGDFDASGNMKFTSAATGQPYQRYGNLYNWTAATLGSGLGLSTDGQQAKDSICPKGWQLPDNEGTKSFKNLLTTAYGLNANGASVSDSNALNSAPLHFLRTGWYNRAYGNISGRTTYAHWWSNIAGSTTRGRYLYTGQGYAYAQTSTLRGYGFAIRCVAR